MDVSIEKGRPCKAALFKIHCFYILIVFCIQITYFRTCSFQDLLCALLPGPPTVNTTLAASGDTVPSSALARTSSL